MIKTVIFDLGKTLIPFDFERGYRSLEKICGYPAADIPRRIGMTDLVMRFETGLVEPEDFVRQLSANLEVSLEYTRFCEIWSSIFIHDPLIPESTLESLGGRYRLLLLSNTNAIHFPMLLESFPPLRHFHGYVLSYEVKAMKPAPEIYRAAIDLAGCRPEECFYTDDIAAYVEGARREGMHAAQFQSREQIEAEMRALGIDW
jgi:glucose-1-phosphatase